MQNFKHATIIEKHPALIIIRVQIYILLKCLKYDVYILYAVKIDETFPKYLKK